MSTADVAQPETALSQAPLPPPPPAAASEQQQQQQPQQQPQQMVGHSHVNGRGLWRSWQRSFRQPLDALLDLIDNAFDANQGHGRIRISTTTASNQNSNTTTTNDDNNNNGEAAASQEQEGILLLNSFPADKYKDMSVVLEVFKSEKDDLAIGENGVGVKQASASLSNFSLVITKYGTRFQIGILCVSLQKPEGIVIPSYTLESNNWENELDSYCDNDEVFHLCMQYLGGRRVPGLSDNNNNNGVGADDEAILEEDTILFLHHGKDRLLQLLVHMNNSEDWSDHECVFALWLDQVRTQESSVNILHGLKDTLPKKYLHLQKPECDILINNVEPQFQYWERRLLELTCFAISISKTSQLTLNPDQPTDNVNTLRIFCGFDPVRASGSGQSCASLYIYSRECGRLVKHQADCRHDLGLPSGGTQYSQGLTIILDDPESSLPLTPTKQDIAWADGENGPVHEANVMAWLKAFSKNYYDYILTFFDGRKGDLNAEVKRHVTVVKTYTNTEDALTPLSEHMSFTRLKGLTWRMSGKNLQLTSKQFMKFQHGEATVMQMTVALRPPAQSQQQTKKRKSNASNNIAAVSQPNKRTNAQAAAQPRPGGFAFGSNSAFANTAWPGTRPNQDTRDSLGSVGAPQPAPVLSGGAAVATAVPVSNGRRQSHTSTTTLWYEKRIKELEAQVKTATHKISALGGQLHSAAKSQSTLRAENQRLEQEAQSLRAQNRQLKEENMGMKQELDQKNEQLLIMEEQLE